MMYPYRHPELEIARNRIADLHRQAERDALALAIGRARRARRDRSRHAMPARPALVRRALAHLRPRTA